MRAIEVRRFGPPDVLQVADRPDPVPRPGQVLVAAAACDVLFVDTMIRSGAGAGYFPIKPPYVPGNGVGGEVVAVGASVSREWLGRTVAAHTGGPGGTGGYAQLAVADIEHAVAVPGDVDLLAATAVLHDGTTALRVLEVTDPRPGEWVLVLGAAGGMGILLVQLLAGQGVNVIGAARGRRSWRPSPARGRPPPSTTANQAGPSPCSRPPAAQGRRSFSTGSAGRSAPPPSTL